MDPARQIKAMRAEYEAAGYTVRLNAAPSLYRLNISEPFRLDLVAMIKKTSFQEQSSAEVRRPRVIIVEIANRKREVSNVPGQATYEKLATKRFEAISRAVRDLGDPSVAFLIRFFEVSADQAEARRLTSMNVRNNEALLAEVVGTRTFLTYGVEVREEKASLLMLIMHWTRWLRILGHRFPGKDRELRTADLRTIQKTFFDEGVLTIPPNEYGHIHQNIMAVIEGGDVDWGQVRRLQPELSLIVEQVALRLVKGQKSSRSSSSEQL